jgi:Phosphate-selective porin O and P
MDRARRRSITAAVAGVFPLMLVGAGICQAAEPTVEQLKAQLSELNQKVSALEMKQADSAAVSATIDAVMRDANKRSQLLQTSGEVSAGYDGAFFLRTGAFVFKPGAQFQFRGVANYREDTTGPKADEIDSGFEVRRMKFYFEGTAFTKDLSYLFQWQVDRKTGTTFLEEAFLRYQLNDQIGVQFGQFKDPVHHEELNSSKNLLAVDRSMVNEVIGGGLNDRIQGVSLQWGGRQKDNPLHAEVVYHDGINSDNTNFQKGVFDFGVSGRVEFKAQGDWGAYRDFSAKGNKSNLLVVGAGGDWSQSGDGDLYLATVDGQFETANGLGIYGAVLLVNRDEEFTGADSSTDWGVVLQAGYMLNPSWEVFGRWDMLMFDNEVAFTADSEDTFHEITVGVNYFLGANGAYGHKAKWTLDLNFLPNGAPAAIDGIGILDANDGGTEIFVRTQFQLVI